MTFVRCLPALLSAVAIGAPLAPAAAQNACTTCGPTVSTTYRYKTVYKVTTTTQYRDITKIRYVKPARTDRTYDHERWLRDWRCPLTRR